MNFWSMFLFWLERCLFFSGGLFLGLFLANLSQQNRLIEEGYEAQQEIDKQAAEIRKIEGLEVV